MLNDIGVPEVLIAGNPIHISRIAKDVRTTVAGVIPAGYRVGAHLDSPVIRVNPGFISHRRPDVTNLAATMDLNKVALADDGHAIDENIGRALRKDDRIKAMAAG
jgi:hypothetical protein